MKKKVTIWTMIVVVGAVLVCLAVYYFTPAQQQEPSGVPFKDEQSDVTFEDEPAARALYERMVETMRNAESLSYKNNYMWERESKVGRCTYAIWMKKPNYLRVETINSGGVEGGTLIGDGDYLWVYWPAGNRPRFPFENRESYEKSRAEVYMKEVTPLGKHPVGGKIGLLGARMSKPIFELSTFHGYTSSLQSHIDWVRRMGTEKVEDEECAVIEVSFLNHHRSWYLWLSRQDHLPRKLKQSVRVAYDEVKHEQWSQVTINAEIPPEKFAWAPPEGWQQCRMPDPEERLLKPGQDAPDFELVSANGDKIKLSDYRGKVVWFFLWSAGCPTCREEMCHLQGLHEKYKDKGLVILGFNSPDHKQTALEFLKENSVTFPNILDSSDVAVRVGIEGYKMGGMGLNYIIDREGKVVDAWYVDEKGHRRAIAALEKCGLKLEDL